MCRRSDVGLEVFLVHPGGPFFVHKDDGVWTIPKGLVGPGEDLLLAAQREFNEETGFRAESDRFEPLGTIQQKGGKHVHAWAFLGEWDPTTVRSNTFELEWPPRSGKIVSFPEIDRAEFFDLERARRKILPAQSPFIDRALEVFAQSLD